MASEERTTFADLDRLEQLAESAPRANFFQLVALLERLASGGPRVGEDSAPDKELIGLRHDPSLAFPAGDIASCVIRNKEQLLRALAEERTPPSPRFIVTTTFLGLSGSASPLPLFLSAEVAHEEVTGGLRRPFLDVFHHRLLSLFYRGWSRYSPAHEAERDASDAWAKRLLALGGHDARGQVDDVLSARERLCLLPLLAGRARTALGLQQVLSLVLRLTAPRSEVAITQFTGGWVPIEPRLQMRLSQPTAVLGQTSVLGARVSDAANGFRVHLRHLPEALSGEFLPGGGLHRKVVAVVRDFVREPLSFDLQLEFEGGGGVGFSLSSTAGQPLGTRTFLQGSGGGGRTVVVAGSA